MEYMIFAAGMFLLLLVLMLKGFLDNKKEEKRLIGKLYSDYGILPQKTYKPERFESISHYFEKHKEGSTIDDITWNDLNMDEVFKKMNYTLSAAGEEFLYHSLRTPLYDEQELRKREDRISYFMSHADERVTCQLLFIKLGSTGKFSIYDYLDYLDDLGERSSFRHYAALLLVLVSILFLFVYLPAGLVMLACTLIANIISYFKVKEEIDPYITSFSYIFRLLDLAERLKGQKLEILAQENEILEKAVKGFAAFKRGSFLLMSPGRMSASSNFIDMFLDYARMTLHLDLLQFNRMLRVVRNHAEEIDDMLTVVGSIDAAIAVGAFRAGNPKYCIPVFTDEKRLKGENFWHPLIEEPVKNSINTDRSILVTGSNASGKSTFLKTVAINAILAQTIHTCMADSYETGFFRIYSSMSLRDDLQGKDSYYMVEIKAIKRILDAGKEEGAPLLCFLDEVLRGTNTMERIAASAEILKAFGEGNSLCFAATHDIELTYLLEGIYENYHFEEEIEQNDIFFSYKLLEGRSNTRNAIKLLSIMGFEEKIVKEAEKRVLEKGNMTC